MPAKPTHVVRRSDGSEAGALFDLAPQRKVGLQIEDDALARLLADNGIFPSRPPLLDAGAEGVHGGYASRPQRNWFLTPPLAEVARTLEQIVTPAGYTIAPV